MAAEISVDFVMDFLGEILDTPVRGDTLLRSRWSSIANLLLEMRIYHFSASRLRSRLHALLSSDEVSVIDNHLQANRTRNTLLVRQSRQLAREFSSAGIPLVFIKGAAAIMMGLFNYEERWVSDIDALIPAEASEKARDILLDLGYRASDKQVAEGYHHLDPMYHHGHVAGVELHVRPYPYPGGNDDRLSEEIIGNPVLVDVNGDNLLIASPTDHAWLLARNDVMFHAAARLKEGLEMVLLMRNADIDFDVLYRREAADMLKHTVDTLLVTGNRYYGASALLSPGCDPVLMERWLEWSMSYWKLQLRRAPFLGSLNRYGATIFFTAPGFRNRMRYINWVAAQELSTQHHEVNNPIHQSAHAVMRYSKNYLTHLVHAAVDMLPNR